MNHFVEQAENATCKQGSLLLQVENMSFSEYSKLWREYVNKFAELLPQAADDECSAAAKRIMRLTFEMGLLRCILFLSAPK